MTRDQWIYAGLLGLQMSFAAAAMVDAFPAKIAALCGVLGTGIAGMLTVVKGNLQK